MIAKAKSTCRRRLPTKRSVCELEPDERLETYDDVVDAYIRDFRERAKSEREFFKSRSLSEAIKFAALCMRPDGKRHSHQYRSRRAVLAEAESRLQAISRQLRSCESFGDLYGVVQERIGGIKGVGVLTTYDVSTRIGAHLDLAPDRIYLHAGTAEGAKAIMVTSDRDSIARSELPAAFRRLRSYEAEDCLCSYKRDLSRIARSSQAEPAN